MRNALVAAIVAAIVGAGSAGAASWASGSNGSTSTGTDASPAPAGPPAGPQPPAHAQPSTPPPKHHAPQHAARPLTNADVHHMVVAWNKAHPGWENPVEMTHSQLLLAEIDHPAVYAPNLNQTSRAIRIFEVYGSYAAMSPQIRALLRKQGEHIPANIPYVKPSTHPGAHPAK